MKSLRIVIIKTAFTRRGGPLWPPVSDMPIPVVALRRDRPPCLSSFSPSCKRTTTEGCPYNHNPGQRRFLNNPLKGERFLSSVGYYPEELEAGLKAKG